MLGHEPDAALEYYENLNKKWFKLIKNMLFTRRHHLNILRTPTENFFLLAFSLPFHQALASLRVTPANSL